MLHEAEGYAKSTGSWVSPLSSGPGATNAITTGIADAMSDSVPLLVFTGQVARAGLGRMPFRRRILLVLRANYRNTITRYVRRL